ncbi:hypothetical protein FOXG_21123 [Fusarium oxysporum f. sp. lycopersici 4287]|uniref:Uncharacterized protein n=1 Tax=Fusarium oxysporum f. sp. lycopersici (strain 4287 / CBS 123668 / FGSC 9935 / NRRL 34936) TaxID=426428 RepID=A0A0J9VUL8_FUSO4|nr:hypothetical protein FOXG_21123 [Fusarium oxysporum f. sp. lycopersici 4287]KNB14426.1 hypothetical protein FOXG_21123 [Fusarium oxysporum f. sp. lycopersici 4287]
MIDPDRADLPFKAASSFDDHFVLDGDSAGRAQVTMTLYPSTDTPEPKGVLDFRSVLAPKPNDVQGQ